MRTSGLFAVLAAVLVVSSGAFAADDDPVKIGVLTDMSSLYADLTGPGSLAAVQMAVEDFGGMVLGKPIEVISADHQNKPDIGSALARKWYDEQGVDAIADVPASSVALAVENVTREKHKIALMAGPASSDITGKNCSPYTAQWVFDTYSLAHVTGRAVVESGGDTWYFITADYAFGHALQRDTTSVIEAANGRVLGAVAAPLNTQDFSSYLLQAQASKAKIIGLANAGSDTINAIKQGGEFGIGEGGQKFAALLLFITDIHSLGLKAAQGIRLTTAFYWDQNEASRAWSKRFLERIGHMPTMIQAGNYSAVTHYLKAVQALGSKDPDRVMAKMREMPINDFMTKNGHLRIDGLVLRDMYLYEVKKPSESKGPWDYYKLIRTVPGDQAYRPLDQGGCPLVKN
ncbi:MAG TPA: ABC transporter substrate-binding protein [Stellaceae bacterium]|nr:ABC transporter substrate-binding protein [Stellaceae bacterium]